MIEAFKKLIGEVLANYRYPHLLISDGVTTGVASAVGNLVTVSVLLIFCRSFFGAGLTGLGDSMSAIFVAVVVSLFGGLFAIPFGSNIPEGKNTDAYLRMKKIAIFLLYSFYGALFVSALIFGFFGIIGLPIVQIFMENLPFTNEVQATFVINIFSAVAAIALLRLLAMRFVEKTLEVNEWKNLYIHKYVWLPFYAIVLAVSTTYAII